MLANVSVHVAALVCSAALTAGIAIYSFRNRRQPGALEFAILMAMLANWSLSYAVGLVTVDETWRILWMRVAWFSMATTEVWLLLFALAYTGYDEFVTRRTVAGLLVVPAVVIAAVWTNPWHHLFWTEHDFVTAGGLVIEAPTWGPLFWVEIVYTYLLVAVASALLLGLIYQSDFLYTDQSALLLVGIAVPFVANLLDVFVLSDTVAIDPTPYAFTITGLSFAYALFNRQLFDLVPATRQLGRNTAIDQLDAGVVIVDTENRIIYCNEAAEDVVGRDAADAVGGGVAQLVDESRLDFATDDAIATVERGDRAYEIRASLITDRTDRRIGNTLVIHDVTARRRREERSARRREELQRVNDLNAALRGVNQALVSARSRAEIEETVCDRLVGSDLYRSACIADAATWGGDADRWTVAADGRGATPDPPVIETDLQDASKPGSAEQTLIEPGPDEDGTWTVVPLLYGRTVYGALGLYTERTSVSDRERSVLDELGETIGHAINAVETRRLLSTDTVVELELESTDAADSLVVASRAIPCEFELEGLVPASDSGPVAYVRVTGPEVGRAGDELAAASGTDVEVVRDDETSVLLAWQVTGDGLLGALIEHGANVTEMRADGGRARYELSVASGSDVRSLRDRIRGQYGDTTVLSKVERTQSVEEKGSIATDRLEDLTERQREVLEAAFRAGYFNWPRDSTAEEVAETLDISSATLHSHLRKAEQSLLADLFDTDR